MKAIFFDIDGTIYHPEIGISQNTIDEIHRVQKLGHKCFIASGRPTGFISKEVKSIGFDGYVLANGAHIVTEGKTIDSLTLPYEETKKLIEYVESQGYEYILLTTDRCYLKKESPHMYEFYAWCNIDMDSLCNDYDLDEVLKKTIKLEIRYNKKEDSVGLIERLGAFFHEKHEDSLNIEVSNIDTSKGHGIETMLHYYGLDVDDIMPDGPEDDGIAYLNFYLEEDADKESILRDVRNALEELRTFMDIGEGTIEESQTEDKDWINNWKEFFHQFYVDDILIVPSWEEVAEEDKDKMILHIDPGTAFGTGMHETTQLVIRQLKKYVTHGAEILDVGTGSGILGITALKLGAGHVVGTDLDPCAVSAVQDNKEANQIEDDTFDMMIGNIIDDVEVQNEVGYERYDIVAANILADVLVPLTPVIVHQMKKGAYYITSGILDVKEEVVREAVEKAGLTLVEVTKQGEWVCVTARKD